MKSKTAKIINTTMCGQPCKMIVTDKDIKEYLIRHIQECEECQEPALKHWGREKECQQK